MRECGLYVPCLSKTDRTDSYFRSKWCCSPTVTLGQMSSDFQYSQAGPGLFPRTAVLSDIAEALAAVRSEFDFLTVHTPLGALTPVLVRVPVLLLWNWTPSLASWKGPMYLSHEEWERTFFMS